jgi:predicted metal-dependent peptidase
MIQKAGYSLPASAVRDAGLENLSTEEVYERIMRNAARRPALSMADLLDAAPDDATRTGGETGPGSPANDMERKAALEAHWRNARRQAEVAEEAFMLGKTPMSLEREVQQLDSGQLDWRAYLWRYLVQTPTDFSGFDRRFIGQGVYLEALAGESVKVFVAVDTSGSVSPDHLRAFVSEVRSILEAYPHLRCDLYYADAGLHGPYVLKPGSQIPRPVGGGGTDFRPFFKRVAEEADTWTPTVSVYLTDGFGDFPETPPSFPVLWVVTPGGLDLDHFPFGETVRMTSVRMTSVRMTSVRMTSPR